MCISIALVGVRKNIGGTGMEASRGCTVLNFLKKFHILKKKKRVLILHDTAGCACVVFAVGLGSAKGICAQKVVVLVHLGGGPPSGLFPFLQKGIPISKYTLFGITLFLGRRREGVCGYTDSRPKPCRLRLCKRNMCTESSSVSAFGGGASLRSIPFFTKGDTHQ